MANLKPHDFLNWSDATSDLNLAVKGFCNRTIFSKIDYVKYYDDGRCFILGDHPDELTFRFINDDIYPTFEELNNLPSRYVFLTPDINTYFKGIQKQKHEMNMEMFRFLTDVVHRLYIIEYCRSTKCHELIGFNSAVKESGFIEYAMAHINLLEKFFSDFKKIAPKLELRHASHIIKLPNFFTHTDNNSLYSDSYQEKSHFSARKITNKTKLSIPTAFGQEDVLLTTRESECLNRLAQGFSSKDIASSFNISTRTVEKHIENIRIKSSFRSIKELLDIINICG